MENARTICQQNNYKFFCVIQQRYSYLSPDADSDLFPQIAVNRDLIGYLEYYKDISLVAYSPLLKGQYNQTRIEKEEYQSFINEQKLEKLQSLSVDKNIWVLNYITNAFNGSVALLTTTNVQHLKEVMRHMAL